MRNRRAALLAPAGLAILALTACSPLGSPGAAPSATVAAPATPAAARTATPTSAAPASTHPLACADLGRTSEIRAAFTPDDGSGGTTVGAVGIGDGTLSGATAVAGAGGLACRWTVRSGSQTIGAYTVSVLPGAGPEWTALMYGDGPTPDRRTFAGVKAAATCGDPGCGASAAVGSTWVRVDLIVDGLAEGQSVLGAEDPDVIFGHASSAISRAFDVVRHADAAQLRFPAHPGRPNDPPTCESFLRTSDLAHALGTSDAVYTRQVPDAAYGSVAGAAEHRLGVVSCFGQGSGTAAYSDADITIAPGQAWAVPVTANGDRTLKRIGLPGLADGEQAFSDCTGAARACRVLLDLGGTAIGIDETTHSKAVAEAILAYAR